MSENFFSAYHQIALPEVQGKDLLDTFEMVLRAGPRYCKNTLELFAMCGKNTQKKFVDIAVESRRRIREIIDEPPAGFGTVHPLSGMLAHEIMTQYSAASNEARLQYIKARKKLPGGVNERIQQYEENSVMGHLHLFQLYGDAKVRSLLEMLPPESVDMHGARHQLKYYPIATSA